MLFNQMIWENKIKIWRTNMRQYDLTVLVSVADGEEAAKGIETKINETITKTEGTIYNCEFEGRIDLTTFKKHTQAYKFRLQYAGTNKTLDALQKAFTITEPIIRTMNAKLDTVLNEEQIAALVK